MSDENLPPFNLGRLPLLPRRETKLSPLELAANGTHYGNRTAGDQGDGLTGPKGGETPPPVGPVTIAPVLIPPVPPQKTPVIGIVVEEAPPGFFDGKRRPAKNYQDAVEQSGGQVELLWPGKNGCSIEELLSGVHGLLIPGGKDVNPEKYGESPKVMMGLDLSTPEFDQFEIDMIKAAIRLKIPIRGICRGQQVLNVAAGGTLIQDVASESTLRYPYSMHHRHGTTHGIVVNSGSRLREILGTEILMANSYHHQAVKAVAPGFEIVARAADNIIEAIEMRENKRVIGVQFHPEKPEFDPGLRRKFFEGFIRDARSYQEPIDPNGPVVSRWEKPRSLAELMQTLISRGYRFRRASSEDLLTDSSQVMEIFGQSDGKVDMTIPEEKDESCWIISSAQLFAETLQVECGSPAASPTTQRHLEQLDTLRSKGITFSNVKRPNLGLRAPMSVLFNMNNKTLLAHGISADPVLITVDDLAGWVNTVTKVKAASEPGRGEKVDTAPKPTENLAELEKGIEALVNRGYELRNNMGVAAKTGGDLKRLLNGGSAYLARKDSGSSFWTCTSAEQIRELLFTEIDRLDLLSSEAREALLLVRQLKSAGGSFFTQGKGFKFFKNVPIPLDIQVSWLLRHGRNGEVLAKHPSYQYGGTQMLDGVGHLKSVLREYRQQWTPKVTVP